MQTYEVTGKQITIGIGTELRLSKNQAESRSTSLRNKSKDIFEVLEPVQFKQGEKITLLSENLTKTLLENLKEISDKKSENKTEVPTEYPCIQRTNFGKYNVFDSDKNLLTSKPIKKDEAEKLLSELLAKNQTDNQGDNEHNKRKPETDNVN